MQVEVHATNLNDSSRPLAVSKPFYPGDKQAEPMKPKQTGWLPIHDMWNFANAHKP